MVEKNTIGYNMSGRNISVAEKPITSVLASGEVPVYERELTADEEVLAALGYKPEFKREFGLWTSFCVSFAVLGLLPSFASTFYYVSAQGATRPAIQRANGLLLRVWDTRARPV